MATVKGHGHIQAKEDNVRLDFIIDLRCDELDYNVPRLVEQLPQRVSEFVRERKYDFKELMEKQALIKRYVFGAEIRALFCDTPFKELMRDVELTFTLPPKPVAPPKPQVVIKEVVKEVVQYVPKVVIKEVVKYVERPQPKPEPPKPKTAEDRIRESIEKRVIDVVAVSNTTRELLERYAPQMAADPDLKVALTNLLDSEKMKAFDR